MAPQRPSSACARGSATRGGGREASERNRGGAVWGRDEGTARGRGTGARPAASGRPAEQGRGENRESRERERNLIKSNFEFFSTISNHTQKVLNTKGVPNFKPYHFCFKFTFIWDSNQKLNLKTDECTLLPDSS